MATRTYTGIDLINYLSDYLIAPSGIMPTPVVTVNSQADLNIAQTGDNNWSSGMTLGGDMYDTFDYQVSGDFDFDVVPAIPAAANITKVEYKMAGSVIVNAQALCNGTGFTGTVLGLSYAKAGVGIKFTNPLGEIPGIELTDNQSDENLANPYVSGPLNANATVNISDAFSNSEIYDYSSSPIDKATLITDFGNLVINMILGNDSYPYAAGGTIVNENTYSGQASLSYSITLDNFQMIVTYFEGDPPPFTLTPPSGDVEEGQQITVVGPVEDLEFAFLIGDKVVPVIPKVISPTEVLIEVPAPPSDPCIASIAACPECEDCFTVCEEDLTSEACQACMETCFQCLENELESTEAAEECQQSSQEPPEIPAVLICGDPGTQFTGSVPLGDFTIIVANGSGLYRLVQGKTNDTLYRTERDGSTYDVKIPNPSGKTGFFRG